MTSAGWKFSSSLPGFQYFMVYDTLDIHNLWWDLLMSTTTLFRIPTIALALSMGTVLHFNHVTPYSEKLLANFAKILVCMDVYASRKTKEIILLIDDFPVFLVKKVNICNQLSLLM